MCQENWIKLLREIKDKGVYTPFKKEIEKWLNSHGVIFNVNNLNDFIKKYDKQDVYNWFDMRYGISQAIQNMTNKEWSELIRKVKEEKRYNLFKTAINSYIKHPWRFIKIKDIKDFSVKYRKKDIYDWFNNTINIS